MGNLSIHVESRTVLQLMDDIHLGKYFLPSFQRQFKWEQNNVQELLQSIIEQNPIGAIILWKPSISNPKNVDPFSIPLLDSKIKLKRDILYVIDGQQRLTSLLLLFNKWKIYRNNEKIDRSNVPITYRPDKEKLSRGGKRGTDMGLLLRAFYLPKTASKLEKEEQRMLTKKLFEETPSEHYDKMKTKIEDLLHYPIPVYTMETSDEDEETFQKMAQAFMRVNKEGIKIGNLELMLSFLAGNLGNLGGSLKGDIIRLCGQFETEYGIGLSILIRFILSNFGLKQTQIAKVEQFKKNIERLSIVPPKEASRIMKRSEIALKLSFELLKQELGLGISYLTPSQITFIPIAKYFYIKRIDNLDRINKQDINNILNWFILANFKGIYSAQVDSKLDLSLDLIPHAKRFPIKDMLNNKDKPFPKITMEDIIRGTKTNILRSQYRAYLFLIYIFLVRNSADDWNNVLLKKQKIADLARHHIIPINIIEPILNSEDPDTEEEIINNLANITFIHTNINSEIGDSSPEDYLKTYISQAEKHFIPKDKNLWKLENYSQFWKWRTDRVYTFGKEEFPEIFK